MGFDAVLRAAATVSKLAIPPILKRPSAGTSYFRAVLEVRNNRGSMETPDGTLSYWRLVQPDGTTMASKLKTTSTGSADLTASADATNFPSGSGWYQQGTEVSTGRSEAFVAVATGDTEQHLTLEAGWVENGRVQRISERFFVGDAADQDTILTNTVDIQDRLGVGTDAETTAGATGSLQSKTRAILADTADIQPKIGTPVSTLAADIAAIQTDLGDFSALTNLTSLRTYLGTLLDNANLPVGDLTAIGLGAIFKVGATPTATAVTLVAVTGGAPVPGAADAFKYSEIVFLTGTHKGRRRRIDTYSAADSAGFVTLGSAPALNDICLVLTLPPIGAPADAASDLNDATNSIAGKIRYLRETLIGSPADATTTNSLHGLMGDPVNAAVTPGTEGSLFAHVRKLYDAIVDLATSSGTRKATFTEYVINPTAVLSADPTLEWVDSGTDTLSTTYVVIFQKTITIPEGADGTVNQAFAKLYWRTTVTGAGVKTGNTRWYVSTASETLGAAPSVNATAITDEVAASATTTEHRRSGTIVPGGFPATGTFYLVIGGKVTAGTDTLDADVETDSSVEVTYTTTETI